MRIKFTVSLDELVRAFLSTHNFTMGIGRVYGIDITMSSLPDASIQHAYTSTSNFATFEIETK